jgi:hypothetical protein
MVPATIAGAAFYYTDDSTASAVTATVNFCVRFSLLTDGTTEVKI